MGSRLGDERPSTFADMIVIVEGIVMVVEQRYDLYSLYVLLLDGGNRICNMIYLIPRAKTWTLMLLVYLYPMPPYDTVHGLYMKLSTGHVVLNCCETQI